MKLDNKGFYKCTSANYKVTNNNIQNRVLEDVLKLYEAMNS